MSKKHPLISDEEKKMMKDFYFERIRFEEARDALLASYNHDYEKLKSDMAKIGELRSVKK